MIITAKSGKQYKVVIGLEVHVQIGTETKLFSQAKNEFACPPNHNIALLDIATPGLLPVVNMEAIKKAAVFGFAVEGTVNKESRFDRKHYTYPDLPQGYQITQNFKPLVKNAQIQIKMNNEENANKTIRIERIHIEQDAGKLLHDKIPGKSCVDYNRAGVPLMEIVSHPDMTGPEDAIPYLKELHRILRFTGASEADMEKGSFRCDVNISVMPVQATIFGTRCEIKNVNSFRFVATAIDFEANRQVEEIEAGRKIIQQTRLFDSEKCITVAMRDKEDATDYYYFPDPDLLPIKLDDLTMAEIKSKVPELPQAKIQRYTINLGLNTKEANDLVSDPVYCQYFEHLVNAGHDVKSSLGWVMTELLGRLNKSGTKIKECQVSKEMLCSILEAQKDNKISSKMAKEILDEMLSTGKNIEVIIEEKGLVQMDNTAELENIVIQIINANTSKAQEYRNGRKNLKGFFVGQAMKDSGGKANPQKLNAIIDKLLQ